MLAPFTQPLLYGCYYNMLNSFKTSMAFKTLVPESIHTKGQHRNGLSFLIPYLYHSLRVRIISFDSQDVTTLAAQVPCVFLLNSLFNFHYCSIWRARKLAAVSTDFCSTSPALDSFVRIRTAPIGSPFAIIGAAV